MTATPEPQRRFPTGLAVGLVLIAGIIGAILYFALASDRVVELESRLIEAFDARWTRQAEPSWCEGGCSQSGHEWHSGEPFDAVVAEVTRIADEQGVTVETDDAGQDARLVTLRDGEVELQLGVTGPLWTGSTAAASGTALWFTSVSVFDENGTGGRT